MRDFLFMGVQPERLDRGRIYDGTGRKPNADAIVYRYVTAPVSAFRPSDCVSDISGPETSLEAELEIELAVFGYFEPGRFIIESVECKGRDFTITAEERASIEEKTCEAYAGRKEQRRSDAIDAAADARRDR